MIVPENKEKSQFTLDEFGLIKKYFAPLAKPNSAHVDISLGDDCSVFAFANDERLAVSVDTLVTGVHFPEQALPHQIATRAIAVSLSDLAAMGARPCGITIALTMPVIDNDWVEGFSRGLAQSLAHYAVPLVGGDTTCGPLCISVQVMGALPKDQALTRSGAKPGDLVFVSGTLGDGAAALACISSAHRCLERDYFEDKFYRPVARIALGQALLAVANAGIDISDGLLADAGHIANSSSVAIELREESLPLSLAAKSHTSAKTLQQWALTGGDDYELCFCVSPERQEQVQKISESLGVRLTKVGDVRSGEGVQCIDSSGQIIKIKTGGYQHFS
jgi:thiamine-monophosphate kinase